MNCMREFALDSLVAIGRRTGKRRWAARERTTKVGVRTRFAIGGA
jgi:hypothetical protein